MKTQITALLSSAKMSATMVAEQISFRDSSPEANAVYNAGVEAEENPSPQSQCRCEEAAKGWIRENDEAARKIIQRRIDVRAARAARQPSDGVTRALRGED